VPISKGAPKVGEFSDDEPTSADRLPEVNVQPKKLKDVAFKSSFGPQSLKHDDVHHAVTQIVP